jgi:hypothetical protein
MSREDFMMAKSAGSIPGRLAVYLLVLVLVLASVTGAWAKPTTPEQAGKVAANWLALQSQPLGEFMGQQVKEVQSFPGPEGSSYYYVVYLDLTGFVIVAADDLVEPIIGFVPVGITYDPSPTNPLGALVSNDVPGRVLHAREMEAMSLKAGELLAPENPMAKAQRKWTWLADPRIGQEHLEFGVPDLSEVRVTPFVRSLWSQTTVGGSACYNYYTPPNAGGSSNNYPCGCVATAMSQLMRYWQHPSAGAGTTSFTIWVDNVSQDRSLRGGNGSGGAYDWANMALVPSSPTAAQRSAIGALTHDAGVSVNMSYSASGSGADTLAAAGAFTNVFMYSNARTAYDSGRNLPEGNRNRMVNPNLHAKYPVLFGITGAAGGHAIVCDGYGYEASTMYHHLNMGWAGAADAWYNLPDINTAYYDFTSLYKCVYNVYVTGSGEIIAGRVTAADGSPISGASVTATRAAGGTYSATTDANGIYAIAKVPSGSSYTVSIDKTGYTFTPQSTATGTSTDYSITTGNVGDLDFVGSSVSIIVSSLAINNGDPSTTSTIVTLNNAVTGSTPTHYMASESSSFTGATWQAYATAPSFTLSPGYGTKTVYFKVEMAPSSESAMVSDAIELTAPPLGSLTVTIAPQDAVTAGAQWRVDGGDWQSNGATVSGLSVGQHTVGYSAISGWNTPNSQTVDTVNGLTTTITGTYVQQSPATGALRVIIKPKKVRAAGAQWKVDKGAWRNSGETISGLTVGVHIIKFNRAPGWKTPVKRSVSVAADQTRKVKTIYKPR